MPAGPDIAPPRARPLCLPRPASGPDFRSALCRVAGRAAAMIRPAQLGDLRGRIENVTVPCRVTGWALDAARPGRPVNLEVVLDDDVIGRICACPAPLAPTSAQSVSFPRGTGA